MPLLRPHPPASPRQVYSPVEYDETKPLLIKLQDSRGGETAYNKRGSDMMVGSPPSGYRVTSPPSGYRGISPPTANQSQF